MIQHLKNVIQAIPYLGIYSKDVLKYVTQSPMKMLPTNYALTNLPENNLNHFYV